jgi:geranylgeranyl pyrophosphate synthase
VSAHLAAQSAGARRSLESAAARQVFDRKAIARIVHSSGTDREVEQVKQLYVQRAKDALVPLPPSAVRKALEAVADYAASRGGHVE